MGEDAVIIGRFQPLHRGHQEQLIDPALEEYDEVYLGIGIPADRERSETDPLTYEEREEIFETVYDELTIFGVEDQGDDELWVQEVEKYVPDDFVAVTGNEWTGSCFETQGYDVEYVDEEGIKERTDYSGTEVRERAQDGGEWRPLVDDRVETYLDGLGFEALMEEL